MGGTVEDASWEMKQANSLRLETDRGQKVAPRLRSKHTLIICSYLHKYVCIDIFIYVYILYIYIYI